MANISNANEILIASTKYPIVGKVQTSLASVWPEKMVTGDYTKDSGLVYSSWIIADNRGGIGIKDMDERNESNRYWWGVLNTDFKGHLLLPPLVTDCTNATGTSGPAVAAMISYNSLLYVAFANKVYSINAGNTYSSLLRTITSTATDAIKYDGKIYFACTSDFERFDGTTWQKGSDLGSAQTCKFFAEWDSKLFVLDDSGDLYWSVDEGVTWTASAKSKLDSGEHTSLLLGPNASGETIIYMGTKRGLYALDFDHQHWIETGLMVPYHPKAGAGAVTWRSVIYFPAGMGVYAYDPMNATITPIGLDRDHGVEADYRGTIVKIVPGHNALYALVDIVGDSSDTRTLWPSKDQTDSVFADTATSSGVFKFNGVGWSILKLSGTEDESTSTAVVASVSDSYRLYFGMERSLMYIDLNPDLANPMEISTYEYDTPGRLYTPWFDGDNATVDKLAIRGTAYTTGCSAYETVNVVYGKDYADDTWVALTGSIVSDGETASLFGSGAGAVFKSMRFKTTMTRGSTTTNSPDMRWLRLDYIKLQDAKWFYEVTINIPENGYDGYSAWVMLSNLKAAVASKTLSLFEYRHDELINTRVRVHRVEGLELTGEDSSSKYKVLLMEV